jgi:hypothetical protein
LLHEAVPARLRAVEALREVRPLVEVLADRAARRVAGPVPLARALVSLAGGAHPETALGATDGTGSGTSATRDRMLLLAEPDPPVPLRVAMLAFAAAVLATPVVLLAVAVG